MNKPVLSVEEIHDLEIPDALPANPFLRKTHVECISNEEYEENLTVCCIYLISNLGEGDIIQIPSDSGNTIQVPNELFRSIEHGPFKKDDEIQLLSGEEVEVIQLPKPDYEYNVQDQYVTGKYKVLEATETHVRLMLRPSFIISVPNRSVKFYKRMNQLKRNPFKSGDKIKCVKAVRGLVQGFLYNVTQVENDFVWIAEYDGDRFRYNLFEKWAKVTKHHAKVKKFKARMKLADHVRYYVNRKFTAKPSITQLRKMMIEDKIIGDDISLKDIKILCDQMFSWK